MSKRDQVMNEEPATCSVCASPPRWLVGDKAACNGHLIRVRVLSGTPYDVIPIERPLRCALCNPDDCLGAQCSMAIREREAWDRAHHEGAASRDEEVSRLTRERDEARAEAESILQTLNSERERHVTELESYRSSQASRDAKVEELRAEVRRALAEAEQRTIDRNGARVRARAAAQTLVDWLGADGPAGVDALAKLAVIRGRQLKRERDDALARRDSALERDRIKVLESDVRGLHGVVDATRRERDEALAEVERLNRMRWVLRVDPALFGAAFRRGRRNFIAWIWARIWRKG